MLRPSMVTLSPMISVLLSLLMTLRDGVRARSVLHLELLALRHQIHVLRRSRPRRLRLTPMGRLLWIWISRIWHEWQTALVIVKPETVVAWHRQVSPVENPVLIANVDVQRFHGYASCR